MVEYEDLIDCDLLVGPQHLDAEHDPLSDVLVEEFQVDHHPSMMGLVLDH